MKGEKFRMKGEKFRMRKSTRTVTNSAKENMSVLLLKGEKFRTVG
jgi:ADP-dependent phosphofructokinase/glucokinase